MCPRSGVNGRVPAEQAAGDDPEGVDDGHAQDEQGHGHLGRTEDGQHGQQVAHDHHAGGADEDLGRVEVPGQVAQQGTGKDGAEQGHDGLIRRLVAERDEAQRQGRDDGHARREAVEAVDEVDAVDHAHDPERGHQRGQDALEDERVVGEDPAQELERIVDLEDLQAEQDGEARQRQLEDELPASTDLPLVVDEDRRQPRAPRPRRPR